LRLAGGVDGVNAVRLVWRWCPRYRGGLVVPRVFVNVFLLVRHGECVGGARRSINEALNGWLFGSRRERIERPSDGWGNNGIRIG
jgi:hypothetical protein